MAFIIRASPLTVIALFILFFKGVKGKNVIGESFINPKGNLVLVKKIKERW